MDVEPGRSSSHGRSVEESLEGDEYEALSEIVGHAAELADMALELEE